MNAVELTGPSPEAFRYVTLPDPVAGKDEVLVRLRAASLNFLDVAVLSGQIPVPFPIIPVTDGAGEIASVGEGVSDWAVGDRVIPHFMPDWVDGRMTPRMIAARRGLTRPGSLAQFVAVPARSLVSMPASLTFAESATLPIAATTAWRAVRSARLGPHSTALLLGTGGVSIFALQFAKAHGARVIVTSSSDAKLDRARALGADLTINYGAMPDWDVEALRMTDGEGADLVLETGGATTFPRSVNAAAMGGTVFVIGFLSGNIAQVDVLAVIEKGLRVHGNNAGPVTDLAAATRAIGVHGLRPVVDRSYGMRAAAEAYSSLAAGGHFGKIVVSVD